MNSALNIGFALGVLLPVIGFLFHFMHFSGGRPLVMGGAVLLILAVIGKVATRVAARR